MITFAPIKHPGDKDTSILTWAEGSMCTLELDNYSNFL
jgi:hypothetical protein